MTTPTILVSTGGDGLFSVRGSAVGHELEQRSVRSLISDGRGGVLAIVDGHCLCRRSPRGNWTTIAQSDSDLSCAIAHGDVVFVGTDDADILCVDPDGVAHRLTGFDAVAGRDTWYAGSAIVNGVLMGPPLGVRSITATCDGAAILANVHVGGAPRSTDAGLSWRPTINVGADVHQVCAHPSRPELVVAAAAVGLCISRDAGATWTIERQGLHAPHCSAVAFGTTDIFVSAARDPGAALGAVYRRPIDGDAPLQPLSGGMPRWIDGGADTHCIAALGSIVGVIARRGRLYLSLDDGESWAAVAEGLPNPSGLHIC
jgi:hypothetical protein